MMFLRPWIRRTFGPYMKNLSVEETQKYLGILRMLYFFGATTLCMGGYFMKKEMDKKQEELQGEPVKRDLIPKKPLEARIPSGVIYEHTKGFGFKRIYFDKDEYYKQLEEKAYQEAKKAQEKALAEGNSLPEGAIKLVDSTGE